MDRELIRASAKDFLIVFDSLAKEKFEKKQDWELNSFIKGHQRTNEAEILNFETQKKIRWLVENNKNLFREFALKLINGLNDNDSVRGEIENISNGRFLDSIGLPTKSESSKLIMDFIDKLSRLK